MTETPITAITLKWIKAVKYCELSGDTLEAIRARRRARKWLEGVHWRKQDGVIWINPAEVDKWVENGLCLAA